MKMIRHLTLLRVLSSLSLWLIPAVVSAREPQIEVEQILQTTQSWDGQNYQGYPTGQAQLTVLRITIPPNTALHWHHHPVISVGYVLSGHLTIEKRDTGERTIVYPGQTSWNWRLVMESTSDRPGENRKNPIQRSVGNHGYEHPPSYNGVLLEPC